MLAFLIPLMSRSISTSWDLTTLLLEQTLHSVCNQTSSSHVTIVICHEKPGLAIRFPHVKFIQVDFPLKPSSEANSETCWLGSEIKYADKGRKLLQGYVAAQQHHPTHVMFVDADDFVSQRLAQHCVTMPKCNGWAIEQGYRYTLGSNWIYKKRRNFHLECATSAIFRNDLVPIPTVPEYDRYSHYYSFFINHGYHLTRMMNRGAPLKTLPFPGAIAVMHSSNWSLSENYAVSSVRNNLLKPLKICLNTRPLTPFIRREFGMNLSNLSQPA
jgi:hypothetical protein